MGQAATTSDVDRRALLAGALGAVAIGAAPAGAGFAATPAADTIPLWPGPPPGSPGPDCVETVSPAGSLTGVTQPRLTLFRPVQACTTAIVVMAGGGYAHIESGRESQPACRWLAGLGIKAFELIYRLPGDGWSAQAPFQDAQRALRLVRARAAALGVTRIGALGFSAGAHLAGMTAVRPDASLAAATDAADSFSARPDFAALLYPVIDLRPPLDMPRSVRELLGRDPDPAAAATLSVNLQVTPQTPPMFLAQAADDPISPVENSFRMAAALRKAGIPFDLHVFQAGGHGWGMGRPGSEPAAWPGLFKSWLEQSGALPRRGAPI